MATAQLEQLRCVTDPQVDTEQEVLDLIMADSALANLDFVKTAKELSKKYNDNYDKKK